ncbi:MAG: 5'-deoxynucleotidase, partial [Atopobiaceae bacterium]|nr:5'-deoxynucleotidase [Atopobiaceae bacterium]
MQSTFFAIVSRMKYIDRWALMRSSRPENLSEHALEVAMIAHALAT